MSLNFREIAKIVLLAFYVFSLSACDQNQTPGQKVSEETKTVKTQLKQKPRIALVMKTLTNPFFLAMEKGARQAEKELGFELIVKTAAEETSIHQQIDIVNQLAREKQADAIIIAPGDSLELIPALKGAQDQGIIVVNIDNRLDPAVSKKLGLKNVSFVSVDNEAAAYQSAEYISRLITEPTKVAILEGIPTAMNAQARKAGALRAFSENPHITLIASKTAHWKVDEAYEVIKSIYADHPDTGAIFCSNDMMAIGVIKYLQETGRKSVKVAAFDAIDEAIAAIKAGTLLVTIDQLPARQGYVGATLALELLNGQKVSLETLIDVKVVDKATL